MSPIRWATSAPRVVDRRAASATGTAKRLGDAPAELDRGGGIEPQLAEGHVPERRLRQAERLREPPPDLPFQVGAGERSPACRGPGHRPAGEDRQLCRCERRAGPAALELPARRLEEAPRLDQRQIVHRDVELLGDREAKLSDQLVRRIAAEPRRIDLGDQGGALFTVDLQRERGHAARSDRRMSALGDQLQVLGMEVPAPG